MSDAVHRLIEDYERRIRSAISIIEDPATFGAQRERVRVKLGEYKMFIRELESIPSPAEERYKTALEELRRMEYEHYGHSTYVSEFIDQALSPSGEHKCETCNGDGEIYAEHYGETYGGNCPTCKGTGKHPIGKQKGDRE